MATTPRQADFTKEQWFLDQRHEWNALIDSGWSFSRLTLFDDRYDRFVMVRNGYAVTLQIPKLNCPRRSQTRFLKMAKAIAAAVDEPL